MTKIYKFDISTHFRQPALLFANVQKLWHRFEWDGAATSLDYGLTMKSNKTKKRAVVDKSPRMTNHKLAQLLGNLIRTAKGLCENKPQSPKWKEELEASLKQSVQDKVTAPAQGIIHFRI